MLYLEPGDLQAYRHPQPGWRARFGGGGKKVGWGNEMETNRRRNTGEVFVCIQVIYAGFTIKPNLREEAIKMLFFCSRRGEGRGEGRRGASGGEERLAFIFIQRIYCFNSWHAEQRGGRSNDTGE